MKLSSRERKQAKQQLKNLYLDEFRKNADYTKEELLGFEKTIRTINKCFSKA